MIKKHLNLCKYSLNYYLPVGKTMQNVILSDLAFCPFVEKHAKATHAKATQSNMHTSVF